MNTEGRVSIKGLSKAAVLAALYNNSKPQGFGFLGFDPNPMTEAEAEEVLTQRDYYVDYLRGRVIKVDLKDDDSFNPWLYDRDLGQGAAEAAVASLRR